MMKEAPLVSIIIVNHNGRQLLEACLDSVLAQTYADIEIIAVDNGSTDGSVELLNNNYPQLRLIKNSMNLGYARANNQGIETARGKYIATLNNDAEADPRWIEKLVEAAEKDTSVGICASRQLQLHNPRLIDAAGIILHRGAYPVNRGHNRPDSGEFNETVEVFGAAGASAFYRKAMLEETGLFDEDYFCYQEEFDLSFRARLMGWKCVYVPEAAVRHIGGATLAKQNERTLIYYMERNRLFTVIKDYPFALLIQALPYLLKYEIDIFFRFIKRLEVEPLLARVAALRYIPVMLRKRKGIQGKKKISNSILRQWLGG